MTHKIIRTIGVIVKYASITHCSLKYIGHFCWCAGKSMEPTISPNDLLFVEHITSVAHLERGDIIITKNPFKSTEAICKRITGLPGDKIKDTFMLNVIPDGHVWLQGDNTDSSTDSREYGPVPQGLILGRIYCRVWPLTNSLALKAKSV